MHAPSSPSTLLAADTSHTAHYMGCYRFVYTRHRQLCEVKPPPPSPALLPPLAFPSLSVADTPASWIVRYIVFPAIKTKIKGTKSDAQLQ